MIVVRAPDGEARAGYHWVVSSDSWLPVDGACKVIVTTVPVGCVSEGNGTSVVKVRTADSLPIRPRDSVGNSNRSGRKAFG